MYELIDLGLQAAWNNLWYVTGPYFDWQKETLQGYINVMNGD